MQQSKRLAVGTLVAGTLVTGCAARSPTTAEPSGEGRIDYALPDGQTFRNTGRPVIALSPDASLFAYNAAGGLYLHTIGESEARQVPGTEPALASPFFSPDGHEVAYWDVAGQLKRVATSGGAPVVIADVGSNIFGASWRIDGMILFGQPEGILRVPATGGLSELVIPALGEERIYGPRMLPDGDSVLFSVTTGSWDQAKVVVQSLETGERTVLVEGGHDARFMSTGYLIYARGDGLFGVEFDPGGLTVARESVSLVQGVMRASAQTGAANYDISAEGALVYVRAAEAVDIRTFVWVYRDGGVEPIPIAPANFNEFNLSPDGTRVAVRIGGDPDAVWVYDLTHETSTRVTFESDPVGAFLPTWTPDGARVAFGAPLSWKRADGTGAIERLDEESRRFPMAFSPDGARLVFRDSGENGTLDLGVLTIETGRTAAILEDQEFSEREAVLSPDGRWLAYASDETGEFQVYVRPFPDVNSGQWQISTDGGDWPVWSREGNELFYRGPSGTGVMALAFEAERTFTPRVPTLLFEWAYTSPQNRRMAVSPDGQRFLLLEETTGAQHVIVVEHDWSEKLRRLVYIN